MNDKATSTPSPISKKVRRSPEQWQTIVTAYEQSGLTQQAFCARESLAMSSFHKWRHRLADTPLTESAQPLFVELESPQHPTVTHDAHWDIELSLAHDIVLRLRRA